MGIFVIFQEILHISSIFSQISISQLILLVKIDKFYKFHENIIIFFLTNEGKK